MLEYVASIQPKDPSVGVVRVTIEDQAGFEHGGASSNHHSVRPTNDGGPRSVGCIPTRHITFEKGGNDSLGARRREQPEHMPVVVPGCFRLDVVRHPVFRMSEVGGFNPGALHRYRWGAVANYDPWPGVPPSVTPLVPSNASTEDESTVRVGVRHVARGPSGWNDDIRGPPGCAGAHSADCRVPGRVVGLNPSEPLSVADIQVPGRVTVRVVLGDDQVVPL